MTFAPGSLVSARGREWVVQPESTEDFLLLRPVAGADNEPVGILTDLEEVRPARFEWPDIDNDLGSSMDVGLLRDAVRLGFRSSAGPFRSFARIAVEARPYQLVPLLMAMKLDPVRLLIGDDVGVGKTIEAGLVAAELLASGAASRLTVLCPPHLAEQWAGELSSKFHLDAELVLSSTAPRLERNLAFRESLFERHRITVVSTDFIKSERRRTEFLRAAPDLVIVDEAHTCTVDPTARRSARHYRHELVHALAVSPDRHLLLVTATPHSGKEGAFRSLLSMLHPDLHELSTHDESYPEWARDLIARHFVQRKRHDIRMYADEETPFPTRMELPEADGIYRLSSEYRSFINDLREFSRDRLVESGLDHHHQRMRYWAVLGLLRHAASSPRAARTTLENRNPAANTETVEEADEVGRELVMEGDIADEESVNDTSGGVLDRGEDLTIARIRDLSMRAEELEGPKHDAKLAHLIKLIKKVLQDGFHPIVFCKYIVTAEYVAEYLRESLPKDVAIDAVTGRLPGDQRERAVHALGEHERRILVATDCLSEGINLQTLFSSVVHYDLPWNPTVLEQREGRVDRYGQESREVRVATLYSPDTVIDELVMDVLLRKHRTIRNALGVAIPVPGPTEEFLETAVDRLFATDRLFVSANEGIQGELGLDRDSAYASNKRRLFEEWEDVAQKEKQSQTRYSQRTVHTDEVRRELSAVRDAIGGGSDVARFIAGTIRAFGGVVATHDDDPRRLSIDLRGLPSDLRDNLRHALDLLELPDSIRARTELPVAAGELLVTRTHPFVSTLASHLLDGALDPHVKAAAARAGVIRSDAVERATVLLLLRHRYDLRTGKEEDRISQLVEEASAVAFEPGQRPGELHWLDGDVARRLLDEAKPSGNLGEGQRAQYASNFLRAERFPGLEEQLKSHVTDRAQSALEAHRRVREEAGGGLGRTDIEPHLPPDVLAAYVLVPTGTK